MISKDMVKGFIVGAVSMVVISSAVFAAPVQKSITAVYNNIKIYVDGTLVQPKDAAGNTVEPFISGGTTYLPVRAVGEAFGKEVKWDENTNSVYIGTSPDQTPKDTSVETTEQKEVIVSSAEEFIKAIGSNKKIILKPGTYNISKEANKISNENVIWEDVGDGFQLGIDQVSNLTIQGDGDKPVDIQAEPRYAEIFHLTNCQNVTFKNIRAGHTTISTKAECCAGVLYIRDSQKISITDSILYGCGSEGIFATDVVDLNMKDSVIEKCNAQIMSLFRCANFSFSNCKFRECRNYEMFSFGNLANVVFNNCEVRDNIADEYSLIGFNSYEDNSNGKDFSKDVKFLNTKFINNKTKNFCNCTVDTKDSTFEGNSFDKK